jgi:thiopeptide-type bacteriocin biosynthesis protein
MTAIPAGFFLMREALLDPDVTRRLNAAKSTTALLELLRALFATGDMRDALWLASPELVDALDRPSDSPRLRESLYRYAVRASTRCNPFGCFTSLALGETASRAKFHVTGLPRRVVRLDGGFVEAVCRRSAVTRVRLTSPFYRCAGHYRFIVKRPGEGRVPRLVLTEVEADSVLERAADAARDGISRNELIDMVSSFAETSVDEAKDYVDDLYASGVLVAAVEPPLTDDLHFARFEEELTAGGDPAGYTIRRARRIAADVSAGATCFAKSAAAIRDEGRFEHPIAEILQVDCTRDETVTLPPAVLSEIGNASMAFLALRPPVPDHLIDFKQRFADRWGDTAVPLLMAVDADFGIALTSFDATLPAPLSAGLRSERTLEMTWRGTDDDLTLIDRALAASRRGVEEIVLTNDDELLSRSRPQVTTFTALCSVEAASDEAIDHGAFRIIINAVSAASGLRLIGRFCGIVPGLEERARELVRACSVSDAIDADILYSPSGRESNVIRHARLYDYEIPIGARPSVPAENVLRTEDLLVSVHGNELALWDAKSGRRVRPHLCVPHNHAAPTNVAVYRFLCRLEEQEGLAGGEWSWGPLVHSHYTPRLRIGRSVLARRRWRVSLDVQRELLRTTDRSRSSDLLRRWRDESGCDSEVLAGGLEERVALDLCAPPALEFFAHLVRKGFREVHEALPAQGAFRSGSVRMAHEIVVPFRSPATRSSVAPAAPVMQRSRGSGESWRYLKCYCSRALANDVIDAVAPALRGAIRSGAIDRWFFVRYGDPEWHVRIRFHGHRDGLAHVTEEIERTLQPFVHSGRVWRLQQDTYISEVARFGGDEVLPAVERNFWHDSDAAVDALSLVRSEGAPEWLACVMSIDAFARSFGLNDNLCRDFACARRDFYRAEQDDRDRMRRHAADVARKFRRQVVSELLSPGKISSIFAARSSRIADEVAALALLDRTGRLSTGRAGILASLVHMSANRILAADQRIQEGVAFDLLAVAYDAVAAIRKGNA